MSIKDAKRQLQYNVHVHFAHCFQKLQKNALTFYVGHMGFRRWDILCNISVSEDYSTCVSWFQETLCAFKVCKSMLHHTIQIN